MIKVMGEQRDRVTRATPGLVDKAAEIVHSATVAALSMSSHPPGTPTPSAPGEPPSLVTGALAGSVTVTSTASDRGWAAEIGATTAYARIQELGGVAGKGHKADLPPRPYLKPALEASVGDIGDLFQAGWADAL